MREKGQRRLCQHRRAAEIVVKLLPITAEALPAGRVCRMALFSFLLASLALAGMNNFTTTGASSPKQTSRVSISGDACR
jgi:hypothetical protein